MTARRRRSRPPPRRPRGRATVTTTDARALTGAGGRMAVTHCMQGGSMHIVAGSHFSWRRSEPLTAACSAGAGNGELHRGWRLAAVDEEARQATAKCAVKCKSDASGTSRRSGITGRGAPPLQRLSTARSRPPPWKSTRHRRPLKDTIKAFDTGETPGKTSLKLSGILQLQTKLSRRFQTSNMNPHESQCRPQARLQEPPALQRKSRAFH